MKVIIQFFIIILVSLYSNMVLALHEPYIDSDYEGVITLYEGVPVQPGIPVNIHIEGQTHNVRVSDGDVDYINEWEFVLDDGYISFPDYPFITPYNLLTDFSFLELIITEWSYEFNEMEGLISAYPKHFLINATYSGEAFSFSTVPIPGAIVFFSSALLALFGVQRRSCQRLRRPPQE